MADRSLPTTLIHHPYQPPAGFEAPQVGVHKASTVIFPDVASLRARDWKHKAGYTYGLHGTPTTFTLEERIATLEGGRHCVLLPSGLAAISLVHLGLLDAGDEVLIPENAYGPCREQAQHELVRWGIGHRLYDPLQPEALRGLITPKTRLLWLEAPGSVTMEFPDLAALLAVAREQGLVVALDNTWGAGLAFQPFDLLADGGSGWMRTFLRPMLEQAGYRAVERLKDDERPALVLAQAEGPVAAAGATPVVRLRASVADTGDGSVYRYDREGVLQAVRQAVGR